MVLVITAVTTKISSAGYSSAMWLTVKLYFHLKHVASAHVTASAHC